MIEKNLGNVERLMRLIFGLTLAVWALMQPQMNVIEWFVLAMSLMLVLNGVFSRCYLWYVLEINSCSTRDKGAMPGSTQCV